MDAKIHSAKVCGVKIAKKIQNHYIEKRFASPINKANYVF